MRIFKAPLLFLCVLALLVGIAQYDEWKTSKEKNESEKRNRLFIFEEDEVISLSYENYSENKSIPISIKLEKIKDDWFIDYPVKEKANQRVIKDIIDTLRKYKFQKIITGDKLVMEDFGLNFPVIRIRLIGKNLYELNLGSKSPVGYGIYLMKGSDNNVYLGSQFILTALTKTLSDFKEKKEEIPNLADPEPK
ncbi:MAG: DUF4340 domain-containing protein [Oligoflexales bacterium]|nr:DUF4340 domain-containing protein [Oligoflexales bacterium]